MRSAKKWEDKLRKISFESNVAEGNVRKFTMDNSTLMFFPLWDGILLWSNEIRDKYIPFFPEIEGNYITFNCCVDGRCEIGFPIGNRYIYMEKGMLSLNQVQPVDGYYYPGKKYDGIELAFDLEVMSEEFPPALSDYGLTKDYFQRLIEENDSIFLASSGQKIQTMAEELLIYLRSGDVSVTKLRSEVLRMFLLIKEGELTPARDVTYVSRGQRQIATEAEERLTADLGSHLVISEMAKDYGISASALKKYFVQVYGTNVSDYLRQKRMERASALLSGTMQSVREVALSVGYTHQGKFSEVFKEFSGYSPLEYRRLFFKRKEIGE
ncbi:MAG: helix-turn-helix transcriptional regulator [Oscillospiraceae bacterium]|nr:helix-turn-helix transcriptional regulator [Oscillospiraceae bacterium]